MLEGYESNMELSGSEEKPEEKPAPAPSPEKPEEAKPEKAEEKPEEAKEADKENLFELPDGRKVDAATLSKEWKENFYPEFTRKSQKIAEYEGKEKITKDLDKEDKDIPSWKKPDFEPKSYAEVIDIAKAEAMREIEGKQKAEAERIKEIQDSVTAEINDIKKNDPKLDENALFTHANKYGFQDLKSAYKNMMDIKAASLEAEQRTLKNIKSREADPISGGASGATGADDGVDMGEVSQFTNAVEYLNRLKGNK